MNLDKLSLDDLLMKRRSLRRELSRFRAIWDALDQHLACQIIQNNFELPPYAILGNMDGTGSAGQSRFLMRINEAFAEEAKRRPKLLIQDIHGLSARMGLANWFDWGSLFLLQDPPHARSQPCRCALVERSHSFDLRRAAKCLCWISTTHSGAA